MNNKKVALIIVLMSMCSFLSAYIGTAIPGQSLWCITKGLASEFDIIQSKICTINIEDSLRDYLIGSKLDILISQGELLLSLLDPVVSEYDSALSLINNIDINLNATISRIDSIESKIDNKMVCNSIEIVMPTTIIASGVYCLETSINGAIVIQASDVVLNLNKQEVTQGITIASGFNTITIRDGIVLNANSADAITVNSGTSDITISDVTIKNARRGIYFNSVAGGLIERCSLTSNVTGLELNNSYGITIEKTTAGSNVQSGFSLILSSSNVLTECSALSTGEGNSTILNNNVYGFISQNGFSNIFENCIANATQAFSTTDYNSIVAGFALTGTEQCSKIIECEASNAITSASGVTVPYGILLQGTLGSQLTLTAVPPIPVPLDGNEDMGAVQWSPDGRFVAVSSFQYLRVYQFDRLNFVLQQIAIPDQEPGDLVNTVDWSPDGNYLATGMNQGTSTDIYRIRIYAFDSTNNSLTQVAVPTPQLATDSLNVNSIRWSPDGKYLAAGTTYTSTPSLYVYAFDRVNNTLNLLSTAQPNLSITSIDWSQNGAYIAAGFTLVSVGLRVYSFTPSNATLGLVASADSPTVTAQVNAVQWSPDCSFIAAGCTDFAYYTNGILAIYQFNAATNLSSASVNLVAESTEIGEGMFSVDWSGDGRYLVIGCGFSPFLRVYGYNRGTRSVEALANPDIEPTVNSYGSPNEPQVICVDWSPDGHYVVAVTAGGYSIDPTRIYIYTALSFPSDNVIKNNTVYCNSGAQFPSGVGISGSSICNLIIQNTAYSNPINPSIVSSNYQFVCNVFNPFFQNIPSLMQNIALGSCDPIVMPAQESLLAKQLKAQVIGLETQLAAMETQLFSFQPSLITCSGTSIIIPTTITVSGVYCLSNEILGSIVVNANDVVLDLSNHRVTQGISLSANVDHVTIQNGTVENSSSADAISAVSGASNINILNVSVKNAQRGIAFNGVNGVLVKQCTMVSNSTGIELVASRDVTVVQSIARSNLLSGFSLVSTGTSTIIDCKAINTGQGNNAIITNNVYGFVVQNGFGNVFENCIANATQALSTTDYNSIVAGFALEGASQCNKIIECEASNAITNSSGFTVPYGIYLQDQFNGLNFVTSANTGNPGYNEVYALSWSPDGIYVAVGGVLNGSIGSDVLVFQLDRMTQTLIQVASVSPGGSTNNTIYTVAWSPDGKYLAVGGTIVGNALYMYQFNTTTQSLSQIATDQVAGASTTIHSVSWSPDGQYLVVGGVASGNPTLYLYQFNVVTQALTAVQTNPSLTPSTDVTTTVAWSPDGAYVAVGAASNAENLSLYQFNRATQQLVLVFAVATGSGNNQFLNAVAWSFDAQYLAVVISHIYSSDSPIQVYQLLRGTSPTLQQVAVANPTDTAAPFNDVFTVGWSPDGQYLAMGGQIYGTDPDDLGVYRFDRGASTLTRVASLNPGGGGGDVVRAVAWSPDGQYLAMGGLINGSVSNNDVLIYSALSFPSDNVIKNNTVYCNSGAQFPSGVGISGSSICNYIVGNTAYSNPINPSVISSNYQFVCNVFNSLYQNIPTLLQNIALGSCDPIAIPDNEPLLALQVQAQFGQVSSQLVTVQSQIAYVESQFDATSAPCSASLITITTTITTSGSYCLTNSVSSVTINASGVVLDLSGRVVTGGIVVSSGVQRVTIKNGIVQNNSAADAIVVNPGVRDITIDSVNVNSAQRGIFCNAVSRGLIKNCELVSNITGFEAQQSYNLTLERVIARSNTQSGFSLILSTTNCIKDCSALSTGEGNRAVLQNNVYGFVSQNGYGNVFENCIANATQALSTTDYNSIIAGFALTGTEQFTKIIECEAANAMTNASGVTIPYGIYLQNTFNGLTSVTAQSTGNLSDSVRTIAWTSDDLYVAVGGTFVGADVLVFQFNPASTAYALTLVASVDLGLTVTVFSAQWSPDNQFLATGGYLNSDVVVYLFDHFDYSLKPVASVIPASSTGVVYSVAWSPNGNYLATGGASTTNSFNIYQFDRVGLSLTQIISQSTGSTSDVIQSVAWSPDGTYVAIGGAVSGGNAIQVYSFTSSPAAVAQVAFVNIGNNNTVNALAWSPDGQYLAVGTLMASGNDFSVYQWNRTALTLTPITSVLGTADVLSLSWSPDGRLIAVGGLFAGNDLNIYDFGRGSKSLNLLQSVSPGGTGNDTVQALQWSPDGRFLLTGGTFMGTNVFDVVLYNALSFPSDNVITENTVYCNSGAQFPSGVGISGSSICNYIVGNTAYSNPVNPLIVSTDYYFVCNVFNQLFQTGPSLLQNIALASCMPIATPNNAALLAQQLLAQMTIVNTQASYIESLLSNICSATAIRTQTTISSSGVYCLAQNITGSLTINASDVVLSLNNYKITQGLTMNAGLQRVVIRDGVVLNTSTADAITVGVGCSGITLERVKAKNAQRGIALNGVSSGRISDCEMISNVTGIELNSSSNILIERSVATSNKFSGFSLITSYTNTFIDCRALSTGENNLATTNNNIYGFISQSGFGNIFENCIANATQALSTTDYNSIVAGFALTGTESCTKIIECEASNAITSAAGVTIPYGIYLQNTFSGLLSLTVLSTGGLSDSVNALSWSSDDVYVAVGGTLTNNNVQVFQFTPSSSSSALTLVDSIDLITTQTVFALAWSPDNTVLAVGGNFSSGDVSVYSFDRTNQTLSLAAPINTSSNPTESTGISTDVVYAVAWSSNGQYLAVGGLLTTTAFRIYQYDPIAQALTQIVSQSTGSATDTIKAAAWSPDGTYVAIGGSVNGNTLQVYSFTPSPAAVALVASFNFGTDTVNTLAWSPDGNYLAVGAQRASGTDVLIYQWSSTALRLTLVASTTGTTGALNLSWSPGGRFIVVAGLFTGNDLTVYSFDRGAKALNLVQSITPAGTGNDLIQALQWSPDGRFIVAAGTTQSTSLYNVLLYSVLSFPSDNVIMDNIVYCNSGAQFPSGVGISGSSICNLIIQNTAYSNPINPLIVSTNYSFVCNVFNQLFQNVPGLLQNLSLGSCAPIVTPTYELLLAQQLLTAVTSVDTCKPTTVMSATTITTSGSYCLAYDVTGSFLITATCVTLDLNTHCVTGVITVTNSQDVILTNGSFKPDGTAATAAVTVLASNQIQLTNLNIKATTSTVAGVAGRAGMSVAATDVQITGCSIIGGVGRSATTASTAGGSGIVLASGTTRPVIDQCVIISGNGGATSASGAGSDGGQGIDVQDGSINALITNTIIFATGSGGKGTGAGAAGGNGGHGIRITSGAIDAQVRNCIIRNTGAGGTGSPAGAGGKAVLDAVVSGSNESNVLSNFASNIVNSTKFDLQASGEAGIPMPNPPTAVVINPFANVFTS